jgi:hypothetical protein
MATKQEQDINELELQTAKEAAEEAKIRKELAHEQLELQREQLKSLRRENEAARDKVKQNDASRKQALETQIRIKAETARKQALCNHRMGGKDLPGLFNGSEIFTTYQVEYNSFGLAEIRCIRCDKTVKPGEKDFDEIFRLPRKGLESPRPVQFRFARG